MTTDLETRLTTHLAHLCEEIGPRPLGSQANQVAAAYIADGFAACGLEVERQTFPCPLWEEIDTQLEIGGQNVTAWANTLRSSSDQSCRGRLRLSDGSSCRSSRLVSAMRSPYR